MLLVDRGNKDLFDVTRDLILDEEMKTNVRLFLRFGCERVRRNGVLREG